MVSVQPGTVQIVHVVVYSQRSRVASLKTRSGTTRFSIGEGHKASRITWQEHDSNEDQFPNRPLLDRSLSILANPEVANWESRSLPLTAERLPRN